MGILASLLAFPMMAQAAGMGVYIPYAFGDSSSLTTSDTSEDVTVDYKASSGFGVVFDSNIGKNSLYNYRLGLESVSMSRKDADFDLSRYNMIHTFGFGVLRKEMVRLWIGPRINIAYMTGSGDFGYSETAVEFGIAPAIGVNVNLGSVVSLGLDLDYRFSTVGGSFSNDFGVDDSYAGSTTGMTARFLLMFRFGETFDGSDSTYNDL